METFGSLVDKISIANLKIYHAEDIAHDLASTLDEVGKAKLKINGLNDMRTALVAELDLLFKNVLEGKVKIIAYKDYKDYGKK